MSGSSQQRQPSWRSVIMPTEHGGWGFVLEPILLGWLVAPTLAAFLLGFATLSTFLIRRPLKLVLTDRRRGLASRQSQLARRVILVLAVAAGAALVASIWLAGPSFLMSLLLAIPFGTVYLYYDLTKPPRTLQAELSGPLTMGFVATAMAVMDGWTIWLALTLWAALALRSAPSVLYVRARIRLDRGRATRVALPIVAHSIALLLAGVFVWVGLLPALPLLIYVLLLARAAWFLSPARPMISVKTIGFMEMGLGVSLVLSIAIGYWL